MSDNRIESIMALIIEEAKSHTLPADYVSRLYAVEMRITTKIGELMAEHRAIERS